jgi:hypothetical protein
VALGASSAPDHVFDLGEAAQDVLDSVVLAIDLVERGLRWHQGLDQHRALVEIGHEVRPDAQAEGHGRHRDGQRKQTGQTRAAQAGA